MKRLLIILLAILICVPSVFARKKSKKSGDLENNVYTDAAYDFQITCLGNWKPELQKPDKELRLVLTQQQYEIPPELMQYPAMARIPILNIHVDEVEFTPAVYVDSLIRNSYSSKVKKEVLKDLQPLEENLSLEGLKTVAKDFIKVDDYEASQWQGTVHYLKKLGMGETIPRTYSVGIVAIKKDNLMMTCLLSCESVFFPKIFKEVLEMVKTIKWQDIPEGE
ncbi:MAG: hypothetical protein CVT49_00590 [candidate division Zixibacteria bacterium HGW-Zixibacteria-1]|nr:MAG: hypothetical protein CVT49_00590 [candidate division Zixibacteria bacterium HGW-Zixibacteria-1]